MLTLVNAGWLGIAFEEPLVFEFADPHPLQAIALRFLLVEPDYEVLGNGGLGELCVNPRTLKRNEGIRILVGSDEPIHYNEVRLNLGNAKDLPRIIEPNRRPFYVPQFGARALGAVKLVAVVLLLAFAYVSVWVGVDVIPAWDGHLSWMTAVKASGDATLFLVCAGYLALAVREIQFGWYGVVTGRYRDGALAAFGEEGGLAELRRIQAVPGRK